jgi:hypothetical protein
VYLIFIVFLFTVILQVYHLLRILVVSITRTFHCSPRVSLVSSGSLLQKNFKTVWKLWKYDNSYIEAHADSILSYMRI